MTKHFFLSELQKHHTHYSRDYPEGYFPGLVWVKGLVVVAKGVWVQEVQQFSAVTRTFLESKKNEYILFLSTTKFLQYNENDRPN